MKMIINQSRLSVLDEKEASQICGGRSPKRSMFFTMALFLASPGLGVFHLGVQDGYRSAAG